VSFRSCPDACQARADGIINIDILSILLSNVSNRWRCT
jgi:hypothetical protein